MLLGYIGVADISSTNSKFTAVIYRSVLTLTPNRGDVYFELNGNICLSTLLFKHQHCHMIHFLFLLM